MDNEKEVMLTNINDEEVSVIVLYEFDAGQKEILNPTDICCEGVAPSVTIYSVLSVVPDHELELLEEFDDKVLSELEESILSDIIHEEGDYEPDYESMAEDRANAY